MIIIYQISEFLASFLEMLTCFIFCGTFLRKEPIHISNLAHPTLYSLFMAFIILALNNIHLTSAINSAIFFIILMFGLIRFYHGRFIKTLGISLVYLCLLSGIDFLTASTFAFVLNMSIQDVIGEFSMLRVVAILSSKAFCIIICFLISRIVRKNSTLSSRSIIIVSIVSFAMIITSFSMYFMQMKASESDNVNVMVLIFFIIMLTLILTMYYCIIAVSDSNEKSNALALTELRNNSLEHSLTDLENTYSMWRKNIHDYKNNVIAMHDLLENNRVDELREYLGHELAALTSGSSYIHSGNTTVDAVINTKIIQAKNNNIHITFNVSMPESCKINSFHLASILGNLLDNAIEASMTEENPYIHVQISPVKTFLMIKIINKCTKKKLEESTSKSDKVHHGIGLSSVRSLVSIYNGDFSLTLNSGEAIAQAMISVE